MKAMVLKAHSRDNEKKGNLNEKKCGRYVITLEVTAVFYVERTLRSGIYLVYIMVKIMLGSANVLHVSQTMNAAHAVIVVVVVVPLPLKTFLQLNSISN